MARRPSARRGMILATAACALGTAMVTVVGLIGWLRDDPPALTLAVLGIGATLALASFWVLIGLLHHHFDALERLRSRLVMMRAEAGGGARVDAAAQWRQDAECGQLSDAAMGLVDIWRNAAGAPDRRLTEIVGALPEPMVVVTESGMVSLINAQALALLGAERARPGTSILAALDDRDLDAAHRAARADGRPIRADLRHAEGYRLAARVIDIGPGHGALLLLDQNDDAPGAAGPLFCDLSLHETPPAPAPITDDTPLDTLPAWVLDLETTGLEPQASRIVAIGAIRQHGGHMYRGTVIDRLVNPGLPIPTTASAVHGITDVLVETAPGIADVLPEIEQYLTGCSLVGHNIGFDIAVLTAEAARCGRSWPAPPALDTALLIAALEPGRDDLNLETIADEWGVPAVGRHTALGDCLIAGEVYARLLPRLAERGIVTFGGARDFARTAGPALARQRACGWATP